MTQVTEALKAFPVQTRIAVQWGEMDAFNHVNNVVYLRWSETARIDYFDRLELNMDHPEQQKYNVILGYQDCKYIFAVRYPDTIWIGTTVSSIGHDRFVMQCQMFSERHDRIVAISNHEIVTLDYKTFQKVPVPEELQQRINQLEASQQPQ
ncbi:MAG: thioesterase family protein [Bacteroidota bacterium]